MVFGVYCRFIACPLHNSCGSIGSTSTSPSSRDMSGNQADVTGQLGKRLLQSDLMQSFPGRLQDSQLAKKWQKVSSRLLKVLQVGWCHSLCCTGVIFSLLGSDSTAILGQNDSGGSHALLVKPSASAVVLHAANNTMQSGRTLSATQRL